MVYGADLLMAFWRSQSSLVVICKREQSRSKVLNAKEEFFGKSNYTTKKS
jgi:hypothetical protein